MIATLFFVGCARGSAPTTPRVLVRDASPAQARLVDWAVGRYRAAGLEMPPLEFVFHTDPSACNEGIGYYEAGRIDMCTGRVDSFPDLSRKTVLHEMGHAWTERSLTLSEQMRFMDLRGLDTWNSRSESWSERGWEQAAEIVGWGVGDRTLQPVIPQDTPQELATAYKLLTGSTPPGFGSS